MSLSGTHQESRHQFIHRNAANAATENSTPDAHLKTVRKTESSTNQEQHAIGCGYIHIHLHDGQQNIQYSAGIRKKLHDQFVSGHNGEPSWSTKVSARPVCELGQHHANSSAIFVDEFRDNRPWEWAKPASITFEMATEVYMVEVIAKSHY
jgi:hypothetical protein